MMDIKRDIVIVGGCPAGMIAGLLKRMPLLRRLPGRVIGLGFGREDIQTPETPVDPKRLFPVLHFRFQIGSHSFEKLFGRHP